MFRDTPKIITPDSEAMGKLSAIEEFGRFHLYLTYRFIQFFFIIGETMIENGLVFIPMWIKRKSTYEQMLLLH